MRPTLIILYYDREYGQKQNRAIGIYPELKHSHAVNKVRIEDVGGFKD